MSTQPRTTATASSPTRASTVGVGDLESFLVEIIQQMPPEPPSSGRGRPRILPAMALWGGLLVCVLRGFQSQLALWRLLTECGLWYFPRFALSDEAVYQRLEKGGLTALQELFERVRQMLAERLAAIQPPSLAQLAPFASGVYAIDESTLDQIARKLPALREMAAGDERLLPGKLAGVFDIRRQQWHSARFIDQPYQNSKVAAPELVAPLPPGSLILADLGYFAFEWFDDLTTQGYWWVSRLRAKTSFTVMHTFYRQGETFDGLVWLGQYRTDRAAQAVRLSQFRVGQACYQYITNVHDPLRLTLQDMAVLYARRWDIELAFLLIKEHLNLHLLWSGKPIVIQQQLWAVLIISQILQALRLEIAWRAGVDPFEVSMALLVEYAPQYAAQGRDPIAIFVERGRELRFIRPSRRTIIRAPAIPQEAILPLPPDLVLVRPARHSHRNCTPRRKPKAN